MDISVSLKNKGAIGALNSLYKGQDRGFKDLMVKLGRVAQKEIRKQVANFAVHNLPTTHKPGLGKSFKLDRLTISGNVGRISISSEHPYANIHNVGGIIKGTPFLAIPGRRAMKFFQNPPVTKQDLTSQGNFLIKKAKIIPKNYLYYAEQELRNKIPEITRITIRSAWDLRAVSMTRSVKVGGP